jgi:hypothetical protein
MADPDLNLEDYFHDLLENAQAINDMAAGPGWARLVEVVHAKLLVVGDQILSGRVHDREQYIKLTAYREGALAVLGAVDEVNRHVMDAREAVAELHPVTDEEAA